jgi:hypothetical protein
MIRSVQNISRPQDANDAYENPKTVQCDVGVVAFERGAPGEHNRVGGVEYPDEHEGTLRSEPTDKAETKNPHQDANHFDGFKVAKDK